MQYRCLYCESYIWLLSFKVICIYLVLKKKIIDQRYDVSLLLLFAKYFMMTSLLLNDGIPNMDGSED